MIISALKFQYRSFIHQFNLVLIGVKQTKRYNNNDNGRFYCYNAIQYTHYIINVYRILILCNHALYAGQTQALSK